LYKKKTPRTYLLIWWPKFNSVFETLALNQVGRAPSSFPYQMESILMEKHILH
jgi:hypothetical protein